MGKPATLAAAWLASALLPAQAESLQDVVVTATPLGDTPLRSSQPVSVLRGTELDQRRAVSLGDTVSGLPGVTSSGFGTGAGRPIIRGLQGSRVGIKDNGLDTLDASGLSPDHAVVADPLSAGQVEVLRGPATLLYGSGAIGGVVNVVSDRIPTTRLEGIGGDALLTHDTASSGNTGALRLRGGVGDGPRGLNWTLGAFKRKADDYRIPGNAVVGDPQSATGRLPNSFTEGDGTSFGASWVDGWGVAGLAYSTLNSRYGIPSEPEAGTFITMQNRRTEGLVDLDNPFRGVESLRLRVNQVRYLHNEIEGDSGEIATSFQSTGGDARLEAVHAPLAGISGALGVQFRSRNLTVSGEEAYVPSTREREQGLFWVGRRGFGAFDLDFGIRQGQASLRPSAESGSPERSFGLTSFSLGARVPVAGSIALLVNAGSAQRAPSVEELYADGPHAATATFEIGDPNLSKERSGNLEIALQQGSGPLRWKVGAFVQQFGNYIGPFETDTNNDGVADRVDSTGVIQNSPADPQAGDFLRVVYQQADARFRGVEVEATWQPDASPWSLRVFADAVRGSIPGYGNVPLMPPLRAGASVDYRAGPWGGFVSLLNAWSQTRTAPLGTPTDGYLKLDAEISYTWRLGALTQATAFLQGRNLLNEDIRLSTSFVKDQVPMPGRSLYAGLRVAF